MEIVKKGISEDVFVGKCGLADRRAVKQPALGTERQLPLFPKEVAQ